MLALPEKNIVFTGNAWNVRSALDLEASGFDLIGTSSAAIADSLGFGDGEKIPFDLLLTVIRQIRERIALPLSVDLERGYADTLEGLVRNTSRLIEIGCGALNLEDVDPRNARTLLPPDVFAAKIVALKKAFGNRIFINARIDTYLLGIDHSVAATRERMAVYTEAGADGMFIPGLTDGGEIAELVQAAALPVNVMALPGLPPVSELEKLGVKRISFGNFGYEKGYGAHRKLMETIRRTGQLAQLF